MNTTEHNKTRDARDEMVGIADNIYDILRKGSNGGGISSKERRDLQAALREAQKTIESLNAALRSN